ncbi:MAG: nucleotidyltransferase domain-containing protein [Candidatus Aenigmarchaeota archaeon]|nr:nucleotidyltransferase domain-containing protein [Candidatus Aenigmarchaeota archaeon]
MYKKVNITENHLQALILFTKGYNKEYYIREVQRLLKISPRASQLILDNLEKLGALKSKTRGKIKLYSLKKENEISKQYIKLAEKYKLITFLTEKTEIKHLLKEINNISPRTTLIIFGSYAKNIEKKGSDLDILAITGVSFNKKDIENLEKTHTFKISVKTVKTTEFDKNDTLIKEVTENHVILQNGDLFIDLVW